MATDAKNTLYYGDNLEVLRRHVPDACADLIYRLRAARADANKVSDAIDTKIKALTAHVLESLPESGASGVSGMHARVQVVTRQVPAVRDWGALQEYVLLTHSFDLLQRRTNDAAIKARWENGDRVPGVEPFEVDSLSITKL